MLAVPAGVRIWDPPGPPVYTAQVSRTVQSTDLFGPYGNPRVTQDSIAEFEQNVPSVGGKYWGEKLTEYGGIGGHPFQGQQRVRDLYVSRSHRHFGSGVTKPAVYNQPYRLTALSKSGCRINDERLSAPMQSNLGSVARPRAQWPGNHSYYSHRSIFDVFPDFKLQQDAPPVESNGKSSTIGNGMASNIVKGRASNMTATTSHSYDDALRRLHDKLYHTSLYHDSYRGHVHEKRVPQPSPASKKAGLGVLAWKRAARDRPKVGEGGGLMGGTKSYVVALSEDGDEDIGEEVDRQKDEDERNEEDGEEEEEEEEEENDEGKEEEDGGESEANSSQSGDSAEPRSILVTESIKSEQTGSARRPKSSKSRSTGSKRSVSFNDTPQVQILESRGSVRDSVASMASAGTAMPGTGPCWPPSTSLVIENIRGSQLLERRDISQAVGTNTPLTRGGRVDPLKKLLSSSKIGEHVAIKSHRPLTERQSKLPAVPLPSSLASGSSALSRLRESEMESRMQPEDGIHLPDGREVYLHPLEMAQLYGKQHNQPFVIPPSYRMGPIKYSATSGVLPGLHRSSSDPVRKLQDELARRINIRKGYAATPLVLPPAPLSECLEPSGSKVPHRLGLRFKTEAHKRYHTVHPEQTPDLRSTRHSGKKFFFDGDHSSVFRG